MTREQAQEILLLYRLGTADDQDPEFTEALNCVRNDPALKTWFEHHCAMQKAVSSSFDRINPPAGLKEQIISERLGELRKSARPTVALLALAMAVILALIGISISIVGSGPDKNFATYRARMAGKVIRAYPKMDLETNDLASIRQFLATHDGQRDYSLPSGLEKTEGTGCAIFGWQGNRVTMVCFRSGKGTDPQAADLFLFIVDRSTVRKAPPGAEREVLKLKELATASWTQGDKTYLLAGKGDDTFLRQYY